MQTQLNTAIAGRLDRRGEDGQATAEYALLTGVVALVVGLVAAWAAGTGKVSALLDAVFEGLIRAAA
ncbi:MAG: hypothetical protein GY708_12925 [Actinomycetia bacterium]|nr:hypothetical protein [Actinomycetes bacterium]MCP4961567.1 hypothetical protein [Actinomycetes bacterium]